MKQLKKEIRNEEECIHTDTNVVGNLGVEPFMSIRGFSTVQLADGGVWVSEYLYQTHFRKII